MSEEENTEKSGAEKPMTPMTPGQRLATAKATKAAKKAAERGRQAEMLEDKALERASEARDWVTDHGKTLLLAGAVVVGAVVLFTAWSAFDSGRTQKAGSALWAATEALSADIRQDVATGDEEGSTFETASARAEAALSAFQKVDAEHQGTDASTWAKLGQGRAHAELGQWEEARATYENALSNAEGDPTISVLALDGLVASYEALDQQDEALNKLGSLKNLGKHVAPAAAYNQGRILLSQGRRDEAKSALLKVIAQLKAEDAPELPFIQQQTEALLARLDPNRIKTPSFDAEQIRRIMEAQQQGLQP